MVNLYDKICKQCGTGFKGGPRATYCPICRDIRAKEASAKYRNKGRKADRPLGSIDKCKICGKEYVVKSARQMYCPDCAIEQYKKVDQKQGLEYYEKEKDNINLYRTMTRYTERVCKVCGKPFKTKTKKLTCSVECARIWTNQVHREYMKKRKTLNDN
jgi:rubrerythrin